jgi:hypothetical protein
VNGRLPPTREECVAGEPSFACKRAGDREEALDALEGLAQWRSRNDLENMLADPTAGENMKAQRPEYGRRTRSIMTC